MYYAQNTLKGDWPWFTMQKLFKNLLNAYIEELTRL